ncbi:unnamed protein product, partial [Closterium sp. NIES-54]
ARVRPLLPAACCTAACCLCLCLWPSACCFLPLPGAIMTTPNVLAFEPDGRPIEFAVWLDNLQLFLLTDAKEGVSLFDYVSGAAVAPAANAPALERSQWQTRDAAARLAIRNHLLITECAHFSQHKTAKTLYDIVVARYSSPATAAIGRLTLPYLFPDLSSFTTTEDLISHLRATDTRFHVVDDYTRYTTVFPLQRKADIPDVFIPWIRATHLQLRERFQSDFPILRLHSDRGERRIGLVMEVTRTSMIHAAAPHFLWPFAVRYAMHQLNLWPRVSLPETSPTLLWTGKVGDASHFRVWGASAFVRDTTADKLSPRAIPCDVTFDESVPFYRLFPYRTAPRPLPPLLLAPGPPQ